MWWRKSASCSRKPKRPKRNHNQPSSRFKVVGSRQFPRTSNLEPRTQFHWVRLMRVQGESMAPTLRSGQLVIVRTQPSPLRELRRGDIVAARPASLHGAALVKRLIAVPHDRVDIDGRQWRLGDDEYFLLGDASSESLDSRRFGPVSRHELLGPVRVRLWPPKWFPA